MSLSFIFITLIAVFGHAEDFLGTTLLSRPLVLGPLVGCALGHPREGIMIGATLELIFMGNIKVGAAIPPDVITGGVLGTAFALLSGKGAAIALALAIPISVLAEMVLSGLFVWRSAFNKRFMVYAEEGDYRKVQRLHVLSGLLKPLLMGVITFMALQWGSGAMTSFLNHLPAWVGTGLQVAGNVLPALGFALLMNQMYRKNVAPYFFLGCILAAYLKLPLIAVGGLGVIIALLVTRQMSGDSDEGSSAGDPSQSGETPVAFPDGRQITKGDLRRLFIRSLALEANFNFETWQNTGFAFAMIPILRKLYTFPAGMSSALKRHLQFFNTSPYGSTLIMGITAAMEEQHVRDGTVEGESISAVKSGLMGPLAGVFDSLFWGTLKVIAAGVGTSMALKGNWLGPVLFLLIFNVPHLVLRYNLTFIGYKTGTRFLQQLSKSQVMHKLTYGASILGLMVVGAMPVTLMSVKIPLQAGQGIMDQILPGLIPLALTFAVYYCIRKNIKVTYLLAGLLVLGFVGSLAHFLV